MTAATRPAATLTDAQRQHLAHIADDCLRVLGPGVEIDHLQLVDGDGHGQVEVGLRVRYRLGTESMVSEGRGETLIAAHAALRDRLVQDRIGLGVRALWAGARPARR